MLDKLKKIMRRKNTFLNKKKKEIRENNAYELYSWVTLLENLGLLWF